MIYNYVLDNQILNLKNKRSDIVKEKDEIIKQLQSLGLTENQKYNINSGSPQIGISDDVKVQRKYLTYKIMEIEQRLSPIKKQLIELHRIKDSEENKQLLEIFKEIFTTEQIKEIRNEAERRMKGEHPFKVSFNVGESIKIKEDYLKYRKIAKEQIDSMCAFRVMLTKVIENGCKQFGNGDFLKVISPLNRLIIPLNELEKLKKKYFV